MNPIFVRKARRFVKKIVRENIDAEGCGIHTAKDMEDTGFFFFVTVTDNGGAGIVSFAMRDISETPGAEEMFGQIFEVIPWFPICMNAEGYAPPETPENPNDWRQEPKLNQATRAFVELRRGSIFHQNMGRSGIAGEILSERRRIKKMIVYGLKKAALC